MNNKEFQHKLKTLSKSQMKIELMSVNEYRKEKVQPIVNSIIRIIDDGKMCICRPTERGTDAGHFISVGSNVTLSMNFHNIHLQGRNSNGFRGGESLKYYDGLIREYGQDYADFCKSLQQHPVLKLQKWELIELRGRLMNFRKQLRKIHIKNNKHRLELRNQANEIVNIYEKKYQTFTIE